jgi:hypothetical protein
MHVVSGSTILTPLAVRKEGKKERKKRKERKKKKERKKERKISSFLA